MDIPRRSLVVYQHPPTLLLFRNTNRRALTISVHHQQQDQPQLLRRYYFMAYNNNNNSNHSSLIRRQRRDLQTYPRPTIVILINNNQIMLEIPDEIWWRVSSYCDVKSLKNLRNSHPRLRRILLHNAAGWKNHCHILWNKKYHVSREAIDMVYTTTSSSINHDRDTPTDDPFSGVRAYELSKRDAQRDTLTEDELCDSVWWFRFKNSAGADWIRDDPWHQGESAVQMVFLRNGIVRSRQFASRRTNIQWQWIEQPTLLEDEIPKDRGHGAYLRLTVSGRDVPTYIVRRFPPNWGFIMENCWGVFASFELKLKTSARLRLSLAHHPPPRKRQRRHVSEDDLTTECYFEINGHNQWREAFLYNIGARHIPHGPNAMEAFRHACEAALQVR